jgi:hypothetical protein
MQPLIEERARAARDAVARPFDSPLILRMSTDERLAQDGLVAAVEGAGGRFASVVSVGRPERHSGVTGAHQQRGHQHETAGKPDRWCFHVK